VRIRERAACTRKVRDKAKGTKLLLYAGISCRLLLVGVLLLSAASKIRSISAFHEFAAATTSLLQVGPQRGRVLAAASIASELVVIALLVITKLVTAGFVVGGVLLVAYTVAIARALRRGVRTPCRCIGASSDPIHPSLLLRNAGLIVACTLGWVSTSQAGTSVALTAAFAASVTIAAFAVAIVACFDDLVYLARSYPS
jgi:hypothetical protein